MTAHLPDSIRATSLSRRMEEASDAGGGGAGYGRDGGAQQSSGDTVSFGLDAGLSDGPAWL